MSEILNTLTLAALVVAHNNLADHAEVDDVKSFKNKALGREAVAALLVKANEMRAKDNLPLLQVVAEGRLENVAEAPAETAPAETAPVQTAPTEAPKPVAKAKGKKPGRAPSISPSDVIILKVTENPKRATAADRFSNYQTGMTVAEYAAAVGNAVQATRDILWDKKQNWVDVVGPKTAAAKAAKAERTKAPAPAPEGEAETPDAAVVAPQAPEASGATA